MANYIWIIPNARAEYKRKMRSIITLGKSLFKAVTVRENFLMAVHKEATSVFDPFKDYITSALDGYLISCHYLNLLTHSEMTKIKNHLFRPSLSEYSEIILDHALGRIPLIRCFEEQPDNLAKYFQNKYSGYKILGSITQKNILDSLDKYGY